MDEKIQQFIDGELSVIEKELFEKSIMADPVLKAEVQESVFFLERLKAQMLREKVLAIITNDRQESKSNQATNSFFWILILIMIVITAGIWCYWQFCSFD